MTPPAGGGPGPPSVTPGPTLPFSIPLQAGWNLISLPRVPPDPRPQAILASLGDRLQAAFAYRGGSWLSLLPGLPDLSTLREVDVTMGLWVLLAAPADLELQGPPPEETDISLAEGWNLVGFPALRPRLVDKALAALSSDAQPTRARAPTQWDGPTLEAAFTYGNSGWLTYLTGGPQALNTLKELEPGHGYWLRMAQGEMWTVAYRLPTQVRITSLACSAKPEEVVIVNEGQEAQELSGWSLESDPADVQRFDLGARVGSLPAGATVRIYSGSDAPADDPSRAIYRWSAAYIFRDGSPPDYVRLVDQGAVLQTVTCS